MNIQQAKREVAEIVFAAIAGECAPDRLARLEEFVTNHEELARYAVELLHQDAWLHEHCSQVNERTLLASLSEGVAPVASTSASSLQCSMSKPKPLHHDMLASVQWNWLAAAVLLAIGAIAGSLGARWAGDANTPTPTVADAWNPKSQGRYVAKFIGETACRWEPGRMPPIVGAGNLRSGETFNLMEGVAEIELGFAAAGAATLSMEGPARMILTAEGTPSLSQGRFTMRVHPRTQGLAFDMPFGQISASDETSLGVAINGLEVACHVFSGEISIRCPWLSKTAGGSVVQVETGECVRFLVEDNRTVMRQDTAKPWQFATQSSMAADQLEVTKEYVDSVLEATPLVYWRFEESEGGRVRNEVADRFHGIVEGAPTWSQQGANRVIEFGLASSEASPRTHLLADEPFGDELADGYSIEFWVKPSHYHLGSLASLFRQPDAHGALVELGGTPATPSIIEQAGQVRFLHRDPPGEDPTTGTSCFSDVFYEARRWTHVVAVKDHEEMRLYVNGKLVSSADDDSSLDNGMTLLVAQLDLQRDIRAFIGQLDEFAVYSHTLDENTIETHHQLLRSGRQTPDTM